MTQALEVLHREHRAMAAVLHCFAEVLAETRDGKLAPEFDFFEAVISYMWDFPDRFHHPKEDEYLFKALRAKAPDLSDLLDELHGQHVDGDRMLADLSHKLEDWMKVPQDESAGNAFIDAGEAYIEFQRKHAAREERTVMPEARKRLDAADWAPINAAFSDNDDPLFGSRTERAYFRLFSRIVALAPQPWGIAERSAPPPTNDKGEIDPEPSRWDAMQRRAVLNMNWI